MAMMVEIFGYPQFAIEARVLKNHTETRTHGMRVLHYALAEHMCLAASCRQQRRKNFE
jgi:hypothetical protein